MAELDLDSILEFTIQLAREAGAMIKNGQERRFASGASEDQKLNSVDLVTEVDKDVEKFITEKIMAAYPGHKFIGEETYHGQELTDDPTWIVDPIDGTTNFVHGFPMVCTSIGLAVKGMPVVGVVYNPFLEQLFSAAKGRGACLNQGTTLPCTGDRPLASLGEALIIADFGSRRSNPQYKSKMDTMYIVGATPEIGGKMAHSVRILGSAALSICYVAAGMSDTYWEIGCWPWDVCAGICILHEAGGAAFGTKSRPLDGTVDKEMLMGRKYFVIRHISPTETETNFEAQQRLAKEYLDCTDDFDP
ncbi:hypothetical protein TREMEDRAFT_56815 [Tremella mesenterica DSM 1558]|uniref:uncharacterized protein n=1 Tax=Tremella mesenterica (strain ATCC 24925 / CBS 8224 / DSM 1558 / NBRC 9311 / NRRL Y-6157 / RJB 2259-6 / UBC 559-6) TaxID=578456 RepID=UPI0003F4948E|nr:uncharacterized protein TREMEDRAFT_56815 [Tremella mesenterica DSM 1558]EIW70099.1 hypothetical protein TREMEDRAFT_56815 [Tremella mesenterica DSM 1558]